ncbi:hypothetical protein K470DRAFT_270617 [Piedraia hortae CBS 480.64]|uniref:Zn(2)-C6 fungal-type domain-containing protein n=1 Tax=Piedraia hortae CBS 480.64 TaxID=1314780 RepID=A0A6A7C0P4_9PEZI|nr:hypothetical protein K470DRAFT_270617 [Piedraia hortae CBS 480.64]
MSPKPCHEGDESACESVASEPNNQMADQSSTTNGTARPKPVNPKDPNRPRRKKARRACFACQRAHLTCGDERPCLRCIKRGLQDQCHDGVRKKAKYLHDSPDAMTAAGTAAPTMPFQIPETPTVYYASPYGLVDLMGLSAAQLSPTQVSGTQMPMSGLDPTFDGPSFNLADFNFGNHYGALEFGMLGHLSSGAVVSPDHEDHSGLPPYTPTYPYQMQPPSLPMMETSKPLTPIHGWPPANGLDAYNIGQNSLATAYMSPTSIPEPVLVPSKPSTLDGFSDQSLLPQRRSPADIYSSVEHPYSYPEAFHALTVLLQKRFPPKKLSRIAQSLSLIRPSFISCNSDLTKDDLIFMEKCFQRTLCEYEDFFHGSATPTIVCRRTGEIAAVSKEFSMVTGWERDVLLGKEPNRNVNGVNSESESSPESSPRRPQAMFLAELLDEDSVVKFYEDFANVAFGAPRTSIIGEPCSILKYKTQKGDQAEERVRCSMCWLVKPDVFDMPMLIVLNFLPIIQ